MLRELRELRVSCNRRNRRNRRRTKVRALVARGVWGDTHARFSLLLCLRAPAGGRAGSGNTDMTDAPAARCAASRSDGSLKSVILAIDSATGLRVKE